MKKKNVYEWKNFSPVKFIHWKSFGCENYKFEVIYQPAFRHRRHSSHRWKIPKRKAFREKKEKRWGMDLGTWWINVTFGLISRLQVSDDFSVCGCNEGVKKRKKICQIENATKIENINRRKSFKQKAERKFQR